MDILIKFYSKENFCFTLESITRHQILGKLKIGAFDGHMAHDIDGLVYQLNDDNYSFTFSINWECDNTPIFSTFTGLLKLEKKLANSTLKLNWLHVNDTSNPSKCINGSSILSTTPIVKQLDALDFIPVNE